MLNAKCRMQNEGVRFALIVQSFPKEIHLFCIQHSTFCIGGRSLQETLTALRMALMAPFSSRDTWAWEMPRAPATSIWVLPS